MLHDLMEAAPYLALIGIGAGLLLLARDRSDANEHDLSDYHEPDPALDALKRRIVAGLKHGRPAVLAPVHRYYEPSVEDWESILSATPSRDILPPAPPGMNAGSPLYAGMLFDTWHPEDADAVAARWLRELGEQARTAVAR